MGILDTVKKDEGAVLGFWAKYWWLKYVVTYLLGWASAAYVYLHLLGHVAK